MLFKDQRLLWRQPRTGKNIIDSQSLVLGLLDRQNLEASGITQVQQLPQINLKGRLVGFADTGIDYTQNVFRYDDGTSKIQFIYDQTTRGSTPEGFLIGSEYTNAQINEALKAADPSDIVPQKDTAGHGTFLAISEFNANISINGRSLISIQQKIQKEQIMCRD